MAKKFGWRDYSWAVTYTHVEVQTDRQTEQAARYLVQTRAMLLLMLLSVHQRNDM